MTSECSITVRTYECDSYGHVNNAVYLNYLEYARYQLLKDVGFDYPAAIRAGYGVYVAKVSIEYKKPALMEDELLIRSWPVRKGAVSGVIAPRILRGEDLIAEAEITWAFVDSRGVPIKIPPEWDKPGLKPDIYEEGAIC
jgi:acyl-CoA thioester hydrolase